jgi:hypothetical protein
MGAITGDAMKALTLAAADLLEESWVYPVPGETRGYYRLTELEAVELACRLMGIDPEFALSIRLSLLAWNEALEWAGDYAGRVPTARIPDNFAFPRG